MLNILKIKNFLRIKKQKDSCEQKIDEELKERIKEFEKVLMLKYEERKKWLNDNVAFKITEVKKIEVYRLELSGRPYYFEFEFDPGAKRLVRITYSFDNVKREIKEGTEEWEILDDMFLFVYVKNTMDLLKLYEEIKSFSL